MIISISGVSGAGKTSIIGGVCEYLDTLRVPYRVQQEDSFITIRIVKFLVGSSRVKKINRSHMRTSPPQDLLYQIERFGIRYVYPVVVLVEYFLLWVHYEWIERNKILIMDRYVYDYLVTLECNYRYKMNFLRNIFLRFPKPSLAVYVRINQKISMKRNKNSIRGLVTETPEFHAASVRSYDSIFKKISSTTVETGHKTKLGRESAVHYVVELIALLRFRSLALIGIDGAGKTTAAENIVKKLSRDGIAAVHVHFYQNPIFLKFMRTLHLSGAGAMISERNRTKTKRSIIWAFLHFSDALLQYVYTRLKHSGKFIVYDRFFYDYLVSFAYYHVPMGGMFCRLIPPVGMTILLDINPDTAYSRKPENSLSFFKFCASTYKTIASDFSIRTITVNNLSPHEVLDQIFKKFLS